MKLENSFQLRIVGATEKTRDRVAGHGPRWVCATLVSADCTGTCPHPNGYDFQNEQ